MRASTKTKITKLLVSSIMSSELSPKEIVDLCDSLMGHDNFSVDLGYHLKMLVETTMVSPNTISTKRAISNKNLEQSDIESLSKHIYNLVKIRRVSRDHVIELMRMLDPTIGDYFNERKFSIRKMIDIFIDNSQDFTDPLIELLEHSDDSYFEHILDKSE